MLLTVTCLSLSHAGRLLPTSDVIAQVSLALSYPEPFRVTGPLPVECLIGKQKKPILFKVFHPSLSQWFCDFVSV